MPARSAATSLRQRTLVVGRWRVLAVAVVLVSAVVVGGAESAGPTPTTTSGAPGAKPTSPFVSLVAISPSRKMYLVQIARSGLECQSTEREHRTPIARRSGGGQIGTSGAPMRPRTRAPERRLAVTCSSAPCRRIGAHHPASKTPALALPASRDIPERWGG
jgi:hypothetical protein